MDVSIFRTIIIQGFVPAEDDLLLFQQKEAKPFLPVRDPSDLTRKQALRGAWSATPNQDGSETPFKVQSHLSTQIVFAKAVGFGPEAQPRPMQERWENGNKVYLEGLRLVEAVSFYGHCRLRMRRNRRPESTFWRELFEPFDNRLRIHPASSLAILVGV